MKKVIYFLVFLPLISFSQIQYDSDGNLFFEKVYESDQSKQDLKGNINEWVAINFNDANNVIKMNSEDKIITKGTFKLPVTSNGYTYNYDINFDLITDFKEGKYKILFNNIFLKHEQNLNFQMKKDFMSLEDYKTVSLNAAKKIGSYKAMLKLIEKDQYLELYNEAKIDYQNNLNKVQNNLEQMASNIEESVENKSKSSEW